MNIKLVSLSPFSHSLLYHLLPSLASLKKMVINCFYNIHNENIKIALNIPNTEEMHFIDGAKAKNFSQNATITYY